MNETEAFDKLRAVVAEALHGSCAVDAKSDYKRTAVGKVPDRFSLEAGRFGVDSESGIQCHCVLLQERDGKAAR